jgi:peptidoglycan/xylan/chitin deacetylase (PgdA/CDA1 family)
MVPLLVRKLFNKVTWNIQTSEKVVYLTFDDGPIPEVTPWVLDELKKYTAKATFFCIGDNVKKHPDVYASILNAGHSIGNHTMHHVNGWMTDHSTYYKDIHQASTYIHSKLFRPPYGKIRLSQMNTLSKKYNIIMWDVLSKDYDQSLSGEDCYSRVINNLKPGSIIVFHDSLKAEKRLRYALPKVLEYMKENGWVSEAVGQ